MQHLKTAGLAVFLLASSTSMSVAQRAVRTSEAPAATGGFWEFGTDFGGMAFGLKSPFARSYSLGPGLFRGGRYFTDAISIEALVALHRLTVSGTSVNNSAIEVSLLYHLSGERTKPQLYVRPLVTLFRDSLAVGGTSSVMGMGGGAGIKVPARDPRFAFRGEVNYKYTFANSAIFATHTLNVLAGVSAYTR